jgi:hypothetical protein
MDPPSTDCGEVLFRSTRAGAEAIHHAAGEEHQHLSTL